MKAYLKTKHLIYFILCLAAFFRLYRLNFVPPSPSLDEVSIGYNAYSILTTGKDEFGTQFPILLRAYDDFRPAIYVYTVIPFIWLLGLGVLAVRLPSVLMSLGAIYLVYCLCKDLYKSNAYREHIALLSALFLAISPWHIYISRLGHEANLGLTALIGGAYLFIHTVVYNRPKYLIASLVVLAISFGAYQSEKIVVPLFVLMFAFIYRIFLIKYWKVALAASLLGLLISLPLLVSTFSTPEALIRFRGTSAFDFSQKKLTNVKIFTANYISHFKPSWLFRGDRRESHKVPYLGLMYMWEAPLFILGLFIFLHKWRETSSKLIFFWMLIGPIPASIATQTPHAMRAFTMLPAPQIIESLAFVWIFQKVSALGKRLFLWVVTVAALIGVGVLWHNYFIVFPVEQSDSFQYALGKAIEVVKKEQDSWDNIVFSNRGDLYQSYMFFLFYTIFDPFKYQNFNGTVSGGYDQTHHIGKYEFRPIVWDLEKSTVSTLYIGNVNDFSANVATLGTVSELNGNPTIKIVGIP